MEELWPGTPQKQATKGLKKDQIKTDWQEIRATTVPTHSDLIQTKR